MLWRPVCLATCEINITIHILTKRKFSHEKPVLTGRMLFTWCTHRSWHIDSRLHTYCLEGPFWVNGLSGFVWKCLFWNQTQRRSHVLRITVVSKISCYIFRSMICLLLLLLLFLSSRHYQYLIFFFEAGFCWCLFVCLFLAFFVFIIIWSRIKSQLIILTVLASDLKVSPF